MDKASLEEQIQAAGWHCLGFGYLDFVQFGMKFEAGLLYSSPSYVYIYREREMYYIQLYLSYNSINYMLIHTYIYIYI